MKNQKGFLLISLVIVISIILVIAAIEFGKSKNSPGGVIQTGNKAIEQTKQNNAVLQQQGADIQNQINDVNTAPSANQKAIQQAKGALGQ